MKSRLESSMMSRKSRPVRKSGVGPGGTYAVWVAQCEFDRLFTQPRCLFGTFPNSLNDVVGSVKLCPYLLTYA